MELHSNWDTWCVRPRQRFLGASGIQKFGVQKVLRWMCPVQHIAHTSLHACPDSLYAPRAHFSPFFIRSRKQQARAHYTNQRHSLTMSPSHFPYSGSGVLGYKTPSYLPTHIP